MMGQSRWEKEICDEIVKLRVHLRRRNLMESERKQIFARLDRLYKELKEKSAEERLRANLSYIDTEIAKKEGVMQ